MAASKRKNKTKKQTTNRQKQNKAKGEKAFISGDSRDSQTVVTIP